MEGILDETYIKGIFGDEFDPVGWAELRRLFEDETHKLLKDLETAIVVRDTSAAKFLLHTIAGSSLNMGACEFGQFAKTLELRSEVEGIDLEQAESLSTLFNKTLVAMRALAPDTKKPSSGVEDGQKKQSP